MAGEVQTPHAVVTVDGVARPAASVRITREIATDLPGEIVGGGGMVAATGGVEWAEDSRGIADGTLPIVSPLSAVTVEAGVAGPDGALSRRFTGIIDSTDGLASEAVSSSGLIDRSRTLARPVTVPVHLSNEVSAFGDVTKTGLTSLWMAHEVARLAGWPAYHFTATRSVLWASLAGSILPSNSSVGSYTTSGGVPITTIDPATTPGDGVGLALSPDTRIAWPLPTLSSAGGQAVEMSIWCNPAEPGSRLYFELFSKDAATGTLHKGFIVRARDGAVTVYRREDPTILASVPTSGWQAIALHVTWTAAGWQLRLRTKEGVVTLPFINDTAAPSRAGGSDLWELLLTTTSDAAAPSTVAGLVVDRLPDATPRWAEHVFAPRFRTLSNPSDFQNWSASRLIDGEDALAVLRDIAAAECAGLWVDEDGILTLMSRQFMRAAAIAVTVTSTDNVLDYSWSKSLDSTRSTVTVKHLLPAHTVRVTQNLTVWSGSEQRFKPGETVETFIEPDSLVDWWEPDLTLSWGSVAAKPTTTSWWGGQVKVDSTDAVVRTAASADATVDTTVLGPQKALLSIRANGAVGTGNYLDTLGTPVVRARGRATWTEQAYTSTIVGPADAPAYTHDVGWYVQTPAGRQKIADWLAAVTNGGYPTIDNVRVVYDPSLRLGMKVRVADSHVKHWRFDGVLFRIDESISDGAASMSLGLRVTAFDPGLAVTLGMFDRRWAGANLAALNAAHPGHTLGDLDAAPLA